MAHWAPLPFRQQLSYNDKSLTSEFVFASDLIRFKITFTHFEMALKIHCKFEIEGPVR